MKDQNVFQPFSEACGFGECPCSCGDVAHDPAATFRRCDPDTLSRDVIEAAAVRALIPNERTRRHFLTAVGAGTAMAAIHALMPIASLQAMAAETAGPLETRDLRIGFIPICCATPLIMADPTQDPVAWDLYLRSREKPGFYPTAEDLRKASYHNIELLNEAVARDPNFMLAWRHLAVQHDDVATNLQGASPDELAVDHRALAEVALAQARRIQPDAGEVHQAAATHYLSVTRDYERARVECELARRTLPNNSTVESLAGRIAERQGHWEDAVRDEERALSLDPRDQRLHSYCLQVYETTRNYPGAVRELNAIEASTPPGARCPR